MVVYRPAHCRVIAADMRTSSAGRKAWRVSVERLRARFFYFFLTFILACAVPALAKADPPKAAVTADVGGGYARLVFTLGGDVDASVHSAGNVLIIAFDKPILISVDRLPAQASEYIGAARRDPDGRAIRIGLARKVSVNSIPPVTNSSSTCCPTPGPDRRPACRKRSSRNWRAAPAKPSGSSVWHIRPSSRKRSCRCRCI